MSTRRGTFVKRVFAAAVALTAAATLAACSSSGKVNDNPSQVASFGDKIRIGIDMDQPGLGMDVGGTYQGFDVDTATYVAKSLGVPKENISWVEAVPKHREDLLTSGAVDLVVSTYSITPERKQTVDFAGPYFIARQGLLVRRNEEEITSPAKLTDRVLCSVTGTTSLARVQALVGDRVKIRQYSQFSDCVQALANSEVDAVTTDDVILAGFASQPQYKGKLRVLDQTFPNSAEVYGIGVKKGNQQLVDQVNAALKEYIADGSWKASLEANVRPSGYTIPAPPTVGQMP